MFLLIKRSTPFPSTTRSNHSASYRTPTNANESLLSASNTNNNSQFNPADSLTDDVNSISRAKSCDFLSMRRKNLLKAIDENRNALNFKKSELSEYYFKDLNDLRNKYWSKEKKIKLVDIKLNKSSNKLYEKINEVFDVSNAYKRQSVSQNLTDLIKRQFEETKHVNKSALDGFISTKRLERENASSDEEEDIDSSRSSDETGASDKEKKVRFDFDPPLSSIHKKVFIDMHRKEFELEI